MRTLKMNMIVVRHLQANETSRHVKTHHVRHIFTPINQTIKKEFTSCNNLLNTTIQSHPIKMGCCIAIEKCWIVATINPISCSCPVHHGTKF